MSRFGDAVYGLRFAAKPVLCLLAAAMLPTGAAAQSAGQIITQPARDVGLAKTKVPPLLKQVSAAPYSQKGTDSCASIARSIAALTVVLGPDFTGSAAANKRNLARIGGAAVVNSLIPFRGIVREVSGASAAERRRAAAVAAGVARRGFLRGLQAARRCPAQP